MNITMLEMVNRNADALKELLHLLDSIDKMTVAIDGVRQDDTIVELLKPVLKGELRARVRRLEADLVNLGIEFS